MQRLLNKAKVSTFHSSFIFFREFFRLRRERFGGRSARNRTSPDLGRVWGVFSCEWWLIGNFGREEEANSKKFPWWRRIFFFCLFGWQLFLDDDFSSNQKWSEKAVKHGQVPNPSIWQPSADISPAPISRITRLFLESRRSNFRISYLRRINHVVGDCSSAFRARRWHQSAFHPTYGHDEEKIDPRKKEESLSALNDSTLVVVFIACSTTHAKSECLLFLFSYFSAYTAFCIHSARAEWNISKPIHGKSKVMLRSDWWRRRRRSSAESKTTP